MASDLVTDEMCESLRQLQSVRTFDVDGAYAAALRGVYALRGPNFSGAAREIMAGRFLALNLRSEQMMGVFNVRA